MNLKQKISAVLSQAHALNYEYNNGCWECDSEALRMLRALYALTSSKLKPNFCPLLVQYLTARNAKHVCHTLLHIEGVKGLNHVLTTPITRAPIVEEVLKTLEERLRFEPHKFSELDLDELEVMLRATKKITYMPADKTLNGVLELSTMMQK